MYAFFSKIPEVITETQFVGYVTDLANQEHLQIISLNPGRAESSSYAETFRIELTVSAPDYKTMVRFLYALEHSKFAIHVDTWSGEMGGLEKNPLQAAGAESGERIQAQISLVAVNVKKT